MSSLPRLPERPFPTITTRPSNVRTPEAKAEQPVRPQGPSIEHSPLHPLTIGRAAADSAAFAPDSSDRLKRAEVFCTGELLRNVARSLKEPSVDTARQVLDAAMRGLNLSSQQIEDFARHSQPLRKLIEIARQPNATS